MLACMRRGWRVGTAYAVSRCGKRVADCKSAWPPRDASNRREKDVDGAIAQLYTAIDLDPNYSGARAGRRGKTVGPSRDRQRAVPIKASGGGGLARPGALRAAMSATWVGARA